MEVIVIGNVLVIVTVVATWWDLRRLIRRGGAKKWSSTKRFGK